MTPASRVAAAIELLEAIRAAIEAPIGRPADAVAHDYFRDRRFIGSADRRAVSAFVWTGLRRWRRVGWWLDRAGLPPTASLRQAAGLLLDGWTLDGVVQTWSGGRYAPSHLAPADLDRLRAIAGHTIDHPEMDQATRLELPVWLLPRLHQRFGADLARELAAAEAEAPLDLRVNLLKGSRDDARAALLAEGLDATPTPHSPWGLRIQGRHPVTTGAAFRAGLVEIQDEGSQLLAALVEAGPEMRVLDYCAGAGGKTLALAMTMRNRGQLIACDVSAPRLEAATSRLRRAGVHNVERHLLAPGDKFAKRRAGSFDRVLVDAPCSGTGTWRRNPDARLRLSEQDLIELAPKQAAILNAAAAMVKPGGRLIYATCSLLTEENEDQVTRFLSSHAEFSASGPPLRVTPFSHGTDGFFAATLARAA